MDYQAIVATLKQVGFSGFASIEHDTHPGDPDIRVICRRNLKMMRQYIG
jgi:sugar phosphate isomerase/epimerase